MYGIMIKKIIMTMMMEWKGKLMIKIPRLLCIVNNK